MTGQARVGCSGWSYRDWRGVVYPAGAAPRTWFARYAERFDTVEINNTFYRLPSATTVSAWAAQAPEGFCYALKVGQFGSHRKKLRDADQWLPRHLERVEVLGDHLGPNLVQLPPGWRRDATRLDDFLALAPRHIRWAVEVRDPSWLHDGVFEVLARHGAALCIHDLLDDHPWERTASWTYLRFHGPRAISSPYHDAYGSRRLTRVASRLRDWMDTGTDVFAYFNNDYKGHAVTDAELLRSLLSSPAAPGQQGPARVPTQPIGYGPSHRSIPGRQEVVET
ncbi:MAG: DUF72 domain-containing protein [Actinomycetota bacterium]